MGLGKGMDLLDTLFRESGLYDVVVGLQMGVVRSGRVPVLSRAHLEKDHDQNEMVAVEVDGVVVDDGEDDGRCGTVEGGRVWESEPEGGNWR